MPRIENWPRERRNDQETVWGHDDLPIRVIVVPWGADRNDWFATAEVYTDGNALNGVTKEPEEMHSVDISTSDKDLTSAQSREQVENAARRWMENNPNGGRLFELAFDDREVLKEFWDVANDLGRVHAAMTWSTPGDMDIEEHGDDLKIVAEFGTHYAVNGDPVDHRPNMDGYTRVDGGGRIPVTESQVGVHHIIEEVSGNTGVSEEQVWAVLERNDIGSEVYPTVSGKATYYVKR